MLASAVVLAAFIALGSCNIGGGDLPELKINVSLHYAWRVYKERHQKTYESFSVELRRRIAWEGNLKKIEKHNKEFEAGLHSYKLGENKFADLTNEEYREMMLRPYRPRKQTEVATFDVTDIPAAVDWRKQGYVTPVKDQGQCGSCWSFSATGSIEGQHFKATKKLVSLSEQNLVDCSGDEGNEGCNGGLMDQAFQYVIKNKGIDTEKSYPYKAEDGNCKFNKKNIGATISSFKDVKQGDEKDLTNAIATIGPISVAIDASQDSFQLYSEGVYDEPQCSSTQLDHGVLAVGYDTDNDTPYYIVKNSWGTGWGQDGYIWMSRNKDNQCGIATAASYPIV